MEKIKALKEVIVRKKDSGKVRTAANYASCLNKLEIYLGKSSGIFRPETLTPDWVESYVLWLHGQHPDKPQTVDFYFRNLRSMCNHSLKLQKKKWLGGVNPFLSISIKNIHPSKRALAKEEVRVLLSDSLRGRLNEVQRATLDVLLFMLYMRGMVFKDLYDLRWDAVSADGHVRYLRSKTGCLIDTGIPAEAAEIMECYRRADSPYLFLFLHVSQKEGEKEVCEESALRRMNRHAKVIGEKAGFSIPLTTYVMRHTWATLMLEAGKSVELISQCLGHTSIRTTQIYLSRISVRRVDSEVEDMVDRMLRGYAVGEKREKARGKKKDNIRAETEKKPSGKMLSNTGIPQLPLIGNNGDLSEEKSLFFI